MGRLSVFSEPPELDVLLDSVEIGKTPIISEEVTSGVHILRVKDTEKEITILSGKSLQLSLFKDSLIEIPEKKAEASTGAGDVLWCERSGFGLRCGVDHHLGLDGKGAIATLGHNALQPVALEKDI